MIRKKLSLDIFPCRNIIEKYTLEDKYLPLIEVVISTNRDEVLEARLPQQLGVHQLMHRFHLSEAHQVCN